MCSIHRAMLAMSAIHAVRITAATSGKHSRQIHPHQLTARHSSQRHAFQRPSVPHRPCHDLRRCAALATPNPSTSRATFETLKHSVTTGPSACWTLVFQSIQVEEGGPQQQKNHAVAARDSNRGMTAPTPEARTPERGISQ